MRQLLYYGRKRIQSETFSSAGTDTDCFRNTVGILSKPECSIYLIPRGVKVTISKWPLSAVLRNKIIVGPFKAGSKNSQQQSKLHPKF
jgi:hypothetical protein